MGLILPVSDNRFDITFHKNSIVRLILDGEQDSLPNQLIYILPGAGEHPADFVGGDGLTL